MNVHKEGYRIIGIAFAALAAINIFVYFKANTTISSILIIASVLFYIFLLRFFRVPVRNTQSDSHTVYAPADGKVVVIEETLEDEYFKDKRIQVSIFMSVWNVHINWFPFPGIVKFYKYHPGKFLLARHPKSSTENERNTTVLVHESGTEVLMRQIAGIVARRIVCYAKENTPVKQGQELGFIKFGSRVDLFFPLGTKINVELNQKVSGKETPIASLK